MAHENTEEAVQQVSRDANLKSYIQEVSLATVSSKYRACDLPV
jgi:hypothetical protein